MDKQICFIFRKPHPSFHSIEEVFGILIPEFRKHGQIQTLFLPHYAGFRGILRNLISFRREKNTLYHLTGQEYYMALRTGRNTVLTIHDIGSAFSGNLPKDLFIRIFWFWLPALIARRITVISEFSRNEFLRLVPFARRKVSVIHNPLHPELEYHPKSFHTERPVILLIGTKPNKNLERIIPALKDIPCHLVVVGKLNEKQLSLLDEFGFNQESDPQPPARTTSVIQSGRPKGGLSFVVQDSTLSKESEHPISNTEHPTPITDYRSPITDYRSPITDYRTPITDYRLPITDYRLPNTFSHHHNLPYSEITALYENSDLLCFASTYEGFGLPILEAQATGRPVVTADAASMPEVAGEGACLVDPLSVESIREGMLRVIGDPEYRESLILLGLTNTKRFRADRIATKYLRIYEEINKKSANFAN